MGKITEAQKAIINQFRCERVSSKPENLGLISEFSSQKGQQLVKYLQECGWEEDVGGHTAYYFIKSHEGEAVLFFSLKCGSLLDQIDEGAFRKRAKRNKKILSVLRGLNQDGDSREQAELLLERIRMGRDIPVETIKKIYKHKKSTALQILWQMARDREREWNPHTIQVFNTYSAIELVHFCSSDSIRERWKKHQMHHPFGEVMFWKHIAPIVYETQDRIGCQYLYLFAADTSDDGTLVNYYNESLKFEKPEHIGTIKPSYDYCCEFMCQEISTLRENRQSFFDNFNPDDDDIVV